MSKKLLVLLFLGVIRPLPLGAIAHDADDSEFGFNLVVNGNAEYDEAPFYGWNLSPQVGRAFHGGEIGIDDYCIDLADRFFTMAAEPIPARQAFMRQKVELGDYRRRTFLAQTCIRTGDGDIGGFEITFHDRKGRVLRKAATRLRSSEEWRERRVSGRIPARAAFARIKVLGKDRSRDGIVNVDVDNIGFRIISFDHDAVCGAIPPGHLPPPGACRLWFADRPPGHQPPPGRCDELERSVPPGACLIYG